MDYGDQVRVINKDNEYLGLEGVISVVLDDMFLVDTDGDHPGSCRVNPSTQHLC